MTGVLNLTLTGLILAETFESYPNDWAFDAGGTNAVAGLATGVPAHSGSGAFMVNTKNPFGSGAYAKFTKTINLEAGDNRVVKVFRGPAVPACIFDDFPESSLDASRWISEGPYGGSISNGILTINTGGLSALPRDTEPNGGLPKQTGIILAKCQYVSGAPFFEAWGSWNAGDNVIRLDMNKVDANEYTAYVDYSNRVVHDLAAIDYAWHEWKIDFAKAAAKFYEDGSLLYTDSDSASIPVDVTSVVRAVSFAGAMAIDWVGFILSGLIKASLVMGGSTIFDADLCAEGGTWVDGTMYMHGWLPVPSGVIGYQTVELKLRNASGAALVMGNVQNYWDDLIIMLDKVITIQGLQGGQKVELLDSGGSVRRTVTCPETGVDVTIDHSDLILTAYGFSGRFKVYDTDGLTLLYSSPTAPRWGGDVFQWIPNESNLNISTDNTQVYRAGSGLSPATATVTATLTSLDTGNPISGKTVTFTPNLGSCSPSSATTDSNGRASTTFTPGSLAGLAGVRADFAGDATYGASSVQQLIDIYYAQVIVDAAKDFQAWIEGQEVVVAAGDYRLSADFQPQPFTLVTPIMNLSVSGWWAVQIYRRGVLEFSGRILKRSRVGGSSPQLTVTGIDEKSMLQRRVANKTYLDEPKLIIQDLLTRYPCGITAGAISTYGAVISLPATYENLYDALMQIARITGWTFRLNANRTLDFGPTFGSMKSITITTGTNEATARYDEDWSLIDTKIYVVGSAAAASLIGSATDPGASLKYGLIEEAFLEKNLTDQGTLDLRAQALLSQRVGVKETIAVDWIDSLATGTYGPFDILTITDTDVSLSGTFTVHVLQRDLSDANKASLSLSNRILTIADALQAVRKDVKDLGVL